MGTIIPDWEKLNPASLPRAHHRSLLPLFGGVRTRLFARGAQLPGSPSPRSCLLQPGEPSLHALGLGRFPGVTKHPESERWELSLGTGQSQELMANLSRGVRPSPRPSRCRRPPGSVTPALRRGFLHTDPDPGNLCRQDGKTTPAKEGPTRADVLPRRRLPRPVDLQF